MLRPTRLALTLALVASRALAQESPTEQARRDLINRAERARVAGRHEEALDLGARAGQVRMTPSLRLLIAQEHDALGHTLEALDHAERCVQEIGAGATVRNREAILDACTTLRDQLTARVGRLTVRLASHAQGTRVRLGDVELIEPLWNVALPVIPGPHRVRATTAAGAHFEREVSVERGESVVIDVAFPEASATLINVPRAPAPTPHPSTRRVAGPGPWVVAGAGLASLGLSAVFWGMHGSAITERDAACDREGCDPIAMSLDGRARTLTLMTNAALGVGSAALIGAGLWYLLGRTREAPTPPQQRAFVMPLADGLLIGAGGTL